MDRIPPFPQDSAAQFGTCVGDSCGCLHDSTVKVTGSERVLCAALNNAKFACAPNQDLKVGGGGGRGEDAGQAKQMDLSSLEV